MNLLDRDQVLHARPRGEFVEAVVAALSAEPETIDELAHALARFVKPDPGRRFFDGWARGIAEDDSDAGWCAVDLAGRLVVCRSTWFAPERRGDVGYLDGPGEPQVGVRYCLPDDWLLTDDVAGWRATSERRRAERAALPPLDFRAILYGRALCEHLVNGCLAGAREGEADPVPAVHASWLLTPRADLRDRPPRHWLLERRDFIMWDLQYREEQWSCLGACPPGPPPDSAAFRFGGCGTHEIVIYYDLVRYLLGECWARLKDEPGVTAAEEVERLERLKEAWLRTPQEDLSGKVPLAVIEQERRRIPWAVSSHEVMVDDDCPLCQMMAEGPGPVFWHLDGCNMDWDFAFSFHLTRDEWEKEQREHEEFSRRMDEEWAAREANATPEESVWKRTYSAPEGEAEMAGAGGLMLFGLGAHLAELRLDCQEKADGEHWLEALGRDWGNVLAAVRDETGCLVEPVLQRFRDTLGELAAAHPDLAAKCRDLDGKVEKALIRFDDVPF